MGTVRSRPYHDEYTRSRPITAVKHRRARIVLGWGTAWEHLVLWASLFALLLKNIFRHKWDLNSLPLQHKQKMRLQHSHSIHVISSFLSFTLKSVRPMRDLNPRPSD